MQRARSSSLSALFSFQGTGPSNWVAFFVTFAFGFFLQPSEPPLKGAVFLPSIPFTKGSIICYNQGNRNQVGKRGFGNEGVYQRV
ncbi:MAG: hypothetical protein ACLTOU_10690, partial [Acutalibacter sp.]